MEALDEENGPHSQEEPIDNQEEQEEEEPLDDPSASFEIQYQPTLEDKWPYFPSTIQSLEENNIPYIIPSHNLASLATFIGSLTFCVGGAILLSFRFDLYPFDALAIHAFFPILGGIVAPVVCALVWGNGPVCDYGMYPNRKGFKWGIFLAFIFWWLHIGKILWSWSETSNKWKNACQTDPNNMTELGLIWAFTAIFFPLSYQLSCNGYLFTFLNLHHISHHVLCCLITIFAVSVWVVEWEWGWVKGAVWAVEAGVLMWTRMKTGGVFSGIIGLWGGSLGLFISSCFFIWLGGYWNCSSLGVGGLM